MRRDRLAHRADLAPALEEGRVGVAQQAVAELEVAGDERLEARAVDVRCEQLAGGGHRAELHSGRLVERGQRPEGALEGVAAGIDAGLEDLEGRDAHGVHLQPGGEEGRRPALPTALGYMPAMSSRTSPTSGRCASDAGEGGSTAAKT